MHMSGEARVLLWLGSDRRLKLHCIRFRCPQSAVSCSQDVDQCTTPDILALTTAIGHRRKMGMVLSAYHLRKGKRRTEAERLQRLF